MWLCFAPAASALQRIEIQPYPRIARANVARTRVFRPGAFWEGGGSVIKREQDQTESQMPVSCWSGQASVGRAACRSHGPTGMLEREVHYGRDQNLG